MHGVLKKYKKNSGFFFFFYYCTSWRKGLGDSVSFLVQSEELPLSELSHGGPEAQQPGSPQPAQPQQPTLHRPPVGGVPIFPPGPVSRPLFLQMSKRAPFFVRLA